MNTRITNAGLCLMLALTLFVFVTAFLAMGFGVEISHRVVSIVVFGGAIVGVSLLGIALVRDIITERRSSANNGKQSR